ncbi:MAG TPA: LpqB family beta-propeller domain-containing protein [Longimicrobiales bacterium]|nr:LpqB family beta-propeller domain-containing protein [Longimicrobiales bacterium]
MNDIRGGAALGRCFAMFMVATLGAWACEDPKGISTPREPFAARMEPLTTTSLTGTVGMELTPTPTVRAIDGDGRPVQGVVISFVPANGAGVISHAVATTDADGIATVGRWTLGPKAGTQRLTVRFADGRAGVVFTAAAQAGPISRLTPFAGNDQVTRPGERLLRPLVVMAEDAFGNPVADPPVTFVVTSGDGSIGSAVTPTSVEGTAASGRWTLGSGLGTQQARAESGATQVTFSATACDTCIDLVYVRDGVIFRRIGHGSLDVRLALGEQPAWSSDGQRIAFVRYQQGTFVPDIYLMEDDGSNVTRLTTSTDYLAAPHSPSWSPDGQRLAVATGGYYDEGDVYVLTVSDPGGSPVRIAAMAGEPAWSPDGTRISYVSLGRYDLWVMNPDGSGKVKLVNNSPAGGTYTSPAWAADGQRIAVTRCDTQGCAIHAIDLAGLVSTRLTYGYAYEPTWSPDGGRIAYHIWDYTIGGYFSSILVVPADGSQTPTLVADGNSAAWRP